MKQIIRWFHRWMKQLGLSFLRLFKDFMGLKWYLKLLSLVATLVVIKAFPFAASVVILISIVPSNMGLLRSIITAGFYGLALTMATLFAPITLIPLTFLSISHIVQDFKEDLKEKPNWAQVL